MTDLLEIQPASVARQHVESLAAFAQDMDGGVLRDLILALTTTLSDGSTVALFTTDDDYTPAQVAKQLRMSRTHLYKLLDAGHIPSHRVGRDRRIAGSDVIAFEKQRQSERRALAVRLAHADVNHRQAIDELAETMLDAM